jgi:hypothetical protein
MICQNMLWLAWPPRLLRTAVRIVSGRSPSFAKTCSAGICAICGLSLATALRLAT